MRKHKTRDEILIESVEKTYKDFIEFIQNPGRYGAVGLICKIKPEAKELIEANLLNKKIEIDNDLRYIKWKMEKAMGYFRDDL